jgi:hypothetical protein
VEGAYELRDLGVHDRLAHQRQRAVLRVHALNQGRRTTSAGLNSVFGSQLSWKEGEWPGQGGGCTECVRVLQYTTRELSGNERPEWPGERGGCRGCARVHWYTKHTVRLS